MWMSSRWGKFMSSVRNDRQGMGFALNQPPRIFRSLADDSYGGFAVGGILPKRRHQVKSDA
jgi:hypothetical protein